VGIDSNELLIVVRTIPGAAHTVGEFIDVQKNADIIGTVAGDNTLLVIPASAAKTDSVLAFLKDQLFRAG
jgi:transcriptional regulator of arginine metabolism